MNKIYKKWICILLSILILQCTCTQEIVRGAQSNVIECENAMAMSVEQPNLQLNALSACLIDATNNRLLYGKNENEIRAMASTTKIMTLIIVLENANLDDVVEVSSRAAKQPDVQLNINTGEQYILKDLLYSLMLESHNDVAVAIAEHVGGSVEGFVEMMNNKASELGLCNTHFVTPNGLDAQDEQGKHATTAYELAQIAAYAIRNQQFIEITNTKSYSFGEVNGKRKFTVNNKDQFLSMMDGAIGVKTGFTGEAGYCFVGAVQKDGRRFVSVVLGSGWPPNKSYKWKDTRKLMQFGLEHYYDEIIFDERFCKKIAVMDGTRGEVEIYADGKMDMLISDYDEIKVVYEYAEQITAPVMAGEIVGQIVVSVNDDAVLCVPIKTVETVDGKNYLFSLKQLFYIFVDF